MRRTKLIDKPLKYYVVDDDATYVSSLVEAIQFEGHNASGDSDPLSAIRKIKNNSVNFDLMLLDMRLGEDNKGNPLHAVKILMYIMTYRPNARVIIVSQHSVSVEEYIDCFKLGAIAILPKSSSHADIIKISEVYYYKNTEEHIREELIDMLWKYVNKKENKNKGLHLEMLLRNIVDSMHTFEVIGQNIKVESVGEIDLLVEAHNQHDFWKKLDSHQIIIECKNVEDPSQLKVLDRIKALVVHKKGLCRVGIVASMKGFTSGFTNRRNLIYQTDGIYIFMLNRNNIESLVRLSPSQREDHLKEIFSLQ